MSFGACFAHIRLAIVLKRPLFHRITLGAFFAQGTLTFETPPLVFWMSVICKVFRIVIRRLFDVALHACHLCLGFLMVLSSSCRALTGRTFPQTPLCQLPTMFSYSFPNGEECIEEARVTLWSMCISGTYELGKSEPLLGYCPWHTNLLKLHPSSETVLGTGASYYQKCQNSPWNRCFLFSEGVGMKLPGTTSDLLCMREAAANYLKGRCSISV